MRDAFAFDRPAEPPYEFVAVEPDLSGRPVPEAFRDRIMVDTVHDGGAIPEPFASRVPRELLERRFAEERDWGASLVASKLAAQLGLQGFFRARIARVLIDFNRFPGATPHASEGHLDRLAINSPFAERLDYEEKAALLERYYDRVSELMDQAVAGKLIKLSIHTYDERNPSQTRRPEVSLISRCASYQTHSRMPVGVFDPLFPDLLGESTCSRALLHRISLNLERAGFRVGHNHPYLLPEGSIEVRTQVWCFFAYLKERFCAEHPQTVGDPAFELVWGMLLNTNLRVQESEALRGYLHRFHRVPAGLGERFRRARVAYDQVRSYLAASSVTDDYRRSPLRPSSLAVEVRKDLVCEIDRETGRPRRLLPANEERATEIARVIAEALTIFLETDREERLRADAARA
ncbi:MAG: N-formylglutamate amidohydrolase [Planctomycetota bacterium]